MLLSSALTYAVTKKNDLGLSLDYVYNLLTELN